MQAYPAEFVYVTLVLPSLFALTLITEGIHKLVKHESGWFPIVAGITFLTIMASVYIIFLR